MFKRAISAIITVAFLCTQCGLGYALRTEAAEQSSAGNLRGQQEQEQRADATGGMVDALIQAGKRLVQPFMKTGIKRILLVEDDRNILDLMERMVKVWRPKVYVAKAVDRDAALRLFRDEGPFDAVITDYVLGKDGGYGDEIVEAINLQTREKTTPVLILSDGASYQIEPRLAPLKSSGQLIDYKAGKKEIVNNFERFKALLDELDKALGESKATGEARTAGGANEVSEVPSDQDPDVVTRGADAAGVDSDDLLDKAKELYRQYRNAARVIFYEEDGTEIDVLTGSELIDEGDILGLFKEVAVDSDTDDFVTTTERDNVIEVHPWHAAAAAGIGMVEEKALETIRGFLESPTLRGRFNITIEFPAGIEPEAFDRAETLPVASDEARLTAVRQKIAQAAKDSVISGMISFETVGLDKIKISAYTVATAVADFKYSLIAENKDWVIANNLDVLFSSSDAGNLSYIDLEDDSSENRAVLAQAMVALQINNLPAMLLVKDDAAARRLSELNIPNLGLDDIVPVNGNLEAAIKTAIDIMKQRYLRGKMDQVNYYSIEGLDSEIVEFLQSMGTAIVQQALAEIKSPQELYEFLKQMGVNMIVASLNDADMNVYQKALALAESI